MRLGPMAEGVATTLVITQLVRIVHGRMLLAAAAIFRTLTLTLMPLYMRHRPLRVAAFLAGLF